MNRLIIKTIIKLCGEAILLAIIAGVVIVVIGNKNKWDTTSLAYSNAFFIAGGLMIVAGGLARLTASQDWNNSQYLYTESFRNMSSSERANFIINASNSVRMLTLGLLSGILLILISVIVPIIF